MRKLVGFEEATGEVVTHTQTQHAQKIQAKYSEGQEKNNSKSKYNIQENG